jgi:hypothetical protein
MENTVAPINPAPRPRGHVVEVLSADGVLLGNAVWYGTPIIRIPIFTTGTMGVLSINGADQQLPDDQKLPVDPTTVVTFDLTVQPSPSEPNAAAAAKTSEVLPPAA